MPLFLLPSIVHDQTLQRPKMYIISPFLFFANVYKVNYMDIIKTVTNNNTCELG